MRRRLADLAQDLRRECGGRKVPPSNIHLTLAFLGDVPLERIVDLMTMAHAIGAAPFELAIDSQGYWRHNRVVWAGATQCPPSLRDLVAGLGRALQARGFRCDAREYVPHITLLRDAHRAPEPYRAATIVWRAAGFALVRSARREGAFVYEIVNRWPLMSMV